MTFGKKLQLLRKQKGLSQEQLASQIAVSRQAVSKWELESSSPDIDTVVQLSKLFGVTTDYLLNDDLKNYEDLPVVKEKYVNAEMQEKTPFVIGIGMIFIGLLVSFVSWRTYQTEVSVTSGIIVQTLGIVAYEVMKNKYSIPEKQKTNRIFYAVSSWLIFPFFALFISQMVFGIYPKPYSHWMSLVVSATIYFLSCLVISVLLLKK
jgi:transcriptional regulator with XRE-family HTH domain